MKKPHVLNRPMFDTGGTSAYGKGITSNLVSDEQRQRFNYGGRVGLREGTRYYNPRPWEDEFQLGTLPVQSPITTSNTYEVEDLLSEEGDIIAGGDKEYYDIFPNLFKGRRDIAAEKEKTALPPQLTSDMGGETFVAEGEDDLNLRRHKELIADPNSDVIDWTEFAEGLYDKKSAKGQAMLGLAGNVLAASQAPKKEAAAILGKGMGEFGKTWASRKEKMEDLAATGKMYEKVNVAKAEAAGQAAIDLEMIKQGISGSDRSQFKTFYSKNLKVDEGLAGVIGFKPKAAPLTKEKKLDVAALKEAAPGSVFKDGNMYILVTEEGIDTDNNAFQIMAKYGRWQDKQNPTGS